MVKRLIQITLSLLLLLIIFLTYLSIYGVSTDKFNNLISEKISERDKNLKIKLNEIKIFLNLNNFNFELKTNDPKVFFKNKEIKIRSISTDLALGNLFVLINACSYAIYLTIVKPLMSRYHFLTIMKWVFSIGFFAVLPFGYSDVLAVEWSEISDKIWGEIAFVVIGTSFLAYMFNIYALKRLRASTVGFYIYLQPVLATVVALILGSDKLDPIKILASLIIFIGVYLVGRKPKAVQE